MKNMVCSSSRRSIFGEYSGEYYLKHYSEITFISPESVLAPVVLDALATDLTPLTALGFMYRESENTSELAQDVKNHVIPAERLRVVFNQEGEPVAFVASTMRETIYGPLYELEGIIVHPDHQGKQLGKKLLLNEIQETHATLLGFQTQNQRMVELGLTLAEPDPNLALELAPLIGTPYPSLLTDSNGYQIVVHEGRYGGSALYHDLDQFMREGKEISGLSTSTGDALVFIGKIKEEICRIDYGPDFSQDADGRIFYSGPNVF